MRLLTAAAALALAVLPGWATIAQASPLELKQVSADAKWVAHLDVDALWEMTVVEKGWQKMLETRENAKQRLSDLRDRIGMDITKDIHAVTAYGTEMRPEGAVLIVNAKVDKQRVMELAERAPDHEVDKYRTHEIHTWTTRQRGQTRTVAASFYKPDIVVLAGSTKSLELALDVLAGREPGIFPDSPLSGKVAAGTVAMLRVAGLSEAELPGRLQMLRQVKSLRFAAGENKSDMFLRAEAEMNDTETAGRAKTMLEGFRAMAEGAIRDNPDARKMLDALKVTSDGKTLTLEWSASAEEIWKMADEFAERAAERRAMRRSRAPKEGI